jgi:integrase
VSSDGISRVCRLRRGPTRPAKEGSEAAFLEAARQYIQKHSAEWQDRGRQRWQAVKKHLAPIHATPLKAITEEQMAALLRPIWRGPGDGVAARVRGFAERVFSAGKVIPNPASWEVQQHHLSKKNIKSKSVESMPYQDVPSFLKALALRPERELARALAFTILTANRVQTVLDADWSWVHPDGINGCVGPTLIVPEGQMKMKVEHAVPLSRQALALLGEPQTHGRIFNVDSETGAINPSSLLKLTKKLAPVTVHGFRASFAVWAEEQPNVVQKAIDLSLAHNKMSRTDAAYKRSRLWTERRDLMQRWADFCLPS